MIKRCLLILIIFQMLFAMLTVIPSHAQDKIPDRFVEDRFIFMGQMDQKPLLVTLSFTRGFSQEGRYSYHAEFDGHLLFQDRWHHLKNGMIRQAHDETSLQDIPPFEPCLFVWREEPQSGAINYDHQEISFLLQFRDVRIVDTAGKRQDFAIQTGLGEGVLQFQGVNIPGRIIYRKMDLTGYNPFAHNVEAMRHKKFNQFFLFGENEFYVIWCEENARWLHHQWVKPKRLVVVKEERTAKGEERTTLLSEDMNVDWTKVERDSDPAREFRVYPVAWKITAKLRPPEKGEDENSEIQEWPTEIAIDLSSVSQYYWFSHGLYLVTGTVNGQKVNGLGEIIRGH